MKVVQDTMSIRLSKAFTIYKLSYRPKNIQAFWYIEYEAWLSCNKTPKEIQLQKTKHRRIFFWYINKMTRIKISKEQTISTSMQKPGKFLHMQGTPNSPKIWSALAYQSSQHQLKANSRLLSIHFRWKNPSKQHTGFVLLKARKPLHSQSHLHF